jgi:hypothetical protein
MSQNIADYIGSQSKYGFIKNIIKEMDTVNAVSQPYLPSPYFVNGFKFDLRIYVLILSSGSSYSTRGLSGDLRGCPDQG